MSQTRLREWNPSGREPISAAHLNEPVDILKRIMRKFGWDVDDIPSERDDPDREWHLGKVVAAGPNGEANYEDERYWVMDCGIVRAANWLQQIEIYEIPEITAEDLGADFDDPIKLTRTVTNLAEILTHAHDIPYGTPVWFRAEYDEAAESPTAGADPLHANPRFCMNAPDMPGRPQYEGMGLFGIGNYGRAWTFTPSVDTLD